MSDMDKSSDKEIQNIYKAHVHDLYSYARHLGFNKETAMDAIHDVFMNIIINGNHLSDILNIRTYLFRALKNRLLNIVKQEPQTVELPDNEDIANEVPFTVDVTVEDIMIQQEEDEKIRQKVEKLLKSLTDRQREIIYLRYMQELEYEQIAEIMNITAPACRKLVHKAIAKLRETGEAVILLYLLSNITSVPVPAKTLF
jgi:RNA polymerase sigma factor (sigma-70 family)